MGLLNTLARDCHAANQHWWHDPATGKAIRRNKGELRMLMVSEVAEAMEGERKSLMDDKLPHRKMVEVEFADILIRVFDYVGGFGLELAEPPGTTLNQMAERLAKKPTNKAEHLLKITKALTSHKKLDLALLLLFEYAGAYGFDLDGAVAEKRAFNASRADHKAEARLRSNGKQW